MSESTSRRTAAAAPGVLLMGATGCGGGASSSSDGGTSTRGLVGRHADFADFDLTQGSDPLPGAPPASGDGSDCGSPGAS